MPHKRAKRSLREQNLQAKGKDLAPSSSLSHEGIPKSVSRILNAAQVRGDYQEKKRKIESGEDVGPSKKRRKQGAGAKGKGETDITIKPGESLAHFNRRVEEDMRPLVRTAVQSAAAVERQARKDKKKESAAKPQAKDDKRKKSETPEASPPPDKHHDRPKEFAKAATSAPRRLNDIAMAPPDLKKLPRGAKKIKEDGGTYPKGSGVLSMAQKAMMEVERERIIKRYRELKQKKLQEAGSRRQEGSDE
ncbi:hypothetical protein EWM64_g3438 [Hericium alpestre]|uniref:Uncharacterized protein n=1 Tax=Hericium alpestre TaxID=135208 RepID=A0A4Z0A295_9AGAM|nr:hypothetical protein EWM64_g3438 [Hericium alpestre]